MKDRIKILVENIDREEIEQIENLNVNDEAQLFALMLSEFYITEKMIEKLIEDLAQKGYPNLVKILQDVKKRAYEIADRKLAEKRLDSKVLLIAIVKNLAIVHGLGKKLLETVLRKAAARSQTALSS